MIALVDFYAAVIYAGVAIGVAVGVFLAAALVFWLVVLIAAAHHI